MTTVLPPISTLVKIIEKYQINNMQIAEIGVFDGSTTKYYLDIIKKNNGTVYAIDWFHGNINVDATSPHGFKDNNEDTYQSFLESIKGFENYVKILKGKTIDTIPQIPNNSLDICFIDADHRYNSVKKDIELCLPKMKKNGIICGHDFEGFNFMPFLKQELEVDVSSRCNCHAGVIQAVHDHFNTNIDILGDYIWLKHLGDNIT